MDYRQLKYFLAVCATSNMTAAAQAECVSEQALSKAVGRLERELGAKLFKRVSRGVELTEEGLALQDEAMAYVRRHEQLLAGFAGRRAGRERLSLAMATGTLATWFGEDFLDSFIIERPNIDLDLVFFSEDTRGPVNAGEGNDLVVGTRPPSGDRETVFHVSRPMRLAMSSCDELASCDVVPLAGLRGRTLACASEETPEQIAMMRKLTAVGCRPRVRFGPSEISLMNSLLKAGRVVIPYGGAGESIAEGIVVREVEGLDVSWNLYGSVRARAALPDAVRELLAAMKARLGVGEG